MRRASETTEALTMEGAGSFDAALCVCWMLLVMVVVAKLSEKPLHSPSGRSNAATPTFVTCVVGLLVVLQYYFVYQAARMSLPAGEPPR